MHQGARALRSSDLCDHSTRAAVIARTIENWTGRRVKPGTKPTVHSARSEGYTKLGPENATGPAAQTGRRRGRK